ncbi:MAG: TonB family protein [bacterium]
MPKSAPVWLVGLVCTVLAVWTSACQPRTWSPSELEALRESVDAYQLYERGACDEVLTRTQPSTLVSWDFNEIRHSTLLLHAYCLERQGSDEDAREIYEQVVREAPLSFASKDARERLRILTIEDEDPERARWMKAVQERSGLTASPRAPLVREPAVFPPLPRTAGLEGYAVVEFGITPEGETVEPVIADAKPPLVFDGAALRAVRDWIFTEKRDGDPDHRQIIRLVFKRKSIPADEEVEIPSRSDAPR